MKTVLITGGSRGIGRQIAMDFAGMGWNVAIGYVSRERQALAVASEFGALAVKADLCDAGAVQRMVCGVEEAFGKIDVLVNNAGIAAGQKLLTDMSESEWKYLFDVNVHGAFRCIQAVLPEMISRKQGKIINISSIWGIEGASCEVCYSAAKSAMIGMTKALAKEVGPSGIQVNCVAPGVVDTEMNALLSDADMRQLREETPLGVIGRPEDISGIVCFLASEKANFITGQVISPNGGICI